MKNYLFVYIFLLLGVSELFATVAGLEVRGIYTEGTTQYVSIFALENQSSRWIRVGMPFDHWKTSRVENDEFILVDNHTEERLRLTKGTVRHVSQKDILPREMALKHLAESFAAAPVVTSVRTADGPKVQTLAEIPDEALSVMSADKVITVAQGDQTVHLVHFSREVLPIELSANLTDSDIDALNVQMAQRVATSTKELTDKLKREIVADAAIRAGK